MHVNYDVHMMVEPDRSFLNNAMHVKENKLCLYNDLVVIQNNR